MAKRKGMVAAFKSSQKTPGPQKKQLPGKLRGDRVRDAASSVPEHSDARRGKVRKTNDDEVHSRGNGRQHTKALVPFEPHERILFVGEGDFSFAASCLANRLDAEGAAGSVATSLDGLEVIVDKYGDQALVNLATIQDAGSLVVHGLDATKMCSQLPTLLAAAGRAVQPLETSRGSHSTFDKIVFMFPHVAGGIADQDRNVLTNQRMLQAFFRESHLLLSASQRANRHSPHAAAFEPKVCVTLAVGHAYDLWDLRGLAKAEGFLNDRSGSFDGTCFPGYIHRRTEGERSGIRRSFAGGHGEERAAKWYIFRPVFETAPSTHALGERGKKPRQGAKRKRSDSESD